MVALISLALTLKFWHHFISYSYQITYNEKPARNCGYSTETMTNSDNNYKNAPVQAKSLLQSLKQEFIYFNQECTNTLSNGNHLNFVDQFLYLSSNIWSSESDVNIGISKAWTVIDTFWSIWKSDVSENKTGILPGCSRIIITVWMHYLNCYEMLGEKAERKLHMLVGWLNFMSYQPL